MLRQATRMSSDFLIEVQTGNIPGYNVVHQFGRNENIPNNSWALVSPTGPSGSFPQTPTTVRIKAGGNSADSSGGAGAREVTVIGLGADLTQISEIIVPSGSGASAVTVNSFYRVYRAHVTAVGTYSSANIGAIVIEDSSGTDDMMTIKADEGRSQHGAFSVPLGKTGYLLSIIVEAHSTKPADFRCFARENLNDTTAPMSSKRVGLYLDGVVGQQIFRPSAPFLTLPALTDVWIEARGTSNTSEVAVDFEVLVVDDPTGSIQ